MWFIQLTQFNTNFKVLINIESIVSIDGCFKDEVGLLPGNGCVVTTSSFKNNVFTVNESIEDIRGMFPVHDVKVVDRKLTPREPIKVDASGIPIVNTRQ